MQTVSNAKKNPKKKTIQEKLKEISILEMLLFIHDYMQITFPLCQTVMAVVLSHKPQFISSIWNDGKNHSMPFLTGFAVFQFYVVVSSCGGEMFLTNYITNYMVFICHWMNQLKDIVNKVSSSGKIDVSFNLILMCG